MGDIRFHSDDPGDQSLMARLLQREIEKVAQLRFVCMELAYALEVAKKCIDGDPQFLGEADAAYIALMKYRQLVNP